MSIGPTGPRSFTRAPTWLLLPLLPLCCSGCFGRVETSDDGKLWLPGDGAAGSTGTGGHSTHPTGGASSQDADPGPNPTAPGPDPGSSLYPSAPTAPACSCAPGGFIRVTRPGEPDGGQASTYVEAPNFLSPKPAACHGSGPSARWLTCDARWQLAACDELNCVSLSSNASGEMAKLSLVERGGGRVLQLSENGHLNLSRKDNSLQGSFSFDANGKVIREGTFSVCIVASHSCADAR